MPRPTPSASVVPSAFNLALYAGDGFDLTVTLSDEDDQPMEIDGEILAQVRATKTDALVAAEFAVDTSTATGVAILSLTGEQTAGLVNGEPFKGVWDVQWSRTDGEPITLMQGVVTCDLDVTRP